MAFKELKSKVQDYLEVLLQGSRKGSSFFSLLLLGPISIQGLGNRICFFRCACCFCVDAVFGFRLSFHCTVSTDGFKALTYGTILVSFIPFLIRLNANYL